MIKAIKRPRFRKKKLKRPIKRTFWGEMNRVVIVKKRRRTGVKMVNFLCENGYTEKFFTKM